MTRAAIDVLDADRWRLLESILDEVLELDPVAARERLEYVHSADPELGRQVAALLDADRRAENFLAVPAPDLVLPLLADDAPRANGVAEAAPEEPAPPARLGRYVVLGEIGRGGMGIVYAGRDETLGRTVAIKALPAAMAADPARLAGFLSEARLLAALHHPNVAAIHGVEQHDGRQYLILERIEGTTLAARLKRGPLPIAEALDVCAQAAEALAAAHAHDIVHRDIKPGNLMCTADGLVKVLDFGLAKQVFADASRVATLGRSGPEATRARFGTPGYMSPEQLLGRPHDGRADLFALGAVLVQCLTGARAFAGSTPHAVLTATLHAPPELSRLPDATPAAVRTLIATLLDKDPEARVADARAVARVLHEARAAIAPASTPIARTAATWLPDAATPFVGRDAEIAAALRLLEHARLVTLTGAAGCGKSRLAIEVARAWSARLGGEALFVDLTAATDAGDVAAAVAAALGTNDHSNAGLGAMLARRLGTRPGLLVLDHADATFAPCARLVTELLARAATLRVVVTSHAWLGAPGEQTTAIAPLALPDPDAAPTAAALGASEAVRLFVACAATAGRPLALTDADAVRVARVVRALDGMPLAIELAAMLLREQSLEAIAADVERRVRDGAAVDAAIRLSYDRLAADEQSLLRALSVFAGGWTLESAAEVCAPQSDAFAMLDRITRLVDHSLVTVHRVAAAEPRYRFLEPIRRFAAALRDAAGETATLAERHLGCHLALAERAAPQLLSGGEQARQLARLEAEHPNLLAALATCETAREGAQRSLRLAGSVWLFWYVRGHFERGREALGRALALPGAERIGAARAQALFAAGGLAAFQDDHAEGRRLTGEAIAAFTALGDRLGVARGLSHIALCATGEGKLAEARDRYREAATIFRELGDGRRLAAALNNLGVVERQQGDDRAALATCEEALALVRAAQDRDGTTVTLVNLALASVRLGRTDDASRWVDEALAHAADLGARRAGAAALEVAAAVLLERGALDDAAQALGAAARVREAIGLPPDAWWKDMVFGLVQRLTTTLGAEDFGARRAAGGELGFDRAVAHARRSLVRILEETT